ncbi:MAG: penicillin-binding protein 1C [Candidatus Cloacimonetes bacterium]|nr:penicillin-binding protein 1C [Candidatus Cloacimonadota bacterium]
MYVLIPLPLENFQDHSRLVLAENGKILRAFLNKDQQWNFPSEPEHIIPAKLKTAVIVYEDRYFFTHHGINLPSLLRAAYLNISAGKIIAGGSTLTMQVARIMDPKARTIASKFIEILQALKLEIRFPKKEILTLYLDHAPYGGNIRGIRTASLRYFGKEPIHLSWSEACVLAVLPNSPGLITPGKRTQELIRKRDDLLRKIAELGLIDQQTLGLSLQEPVTSQQYNFPWHAPHLARRLSADCNEEIIKTTIDYDIQVQIEELLIQHGQYLEYQGIKNISCLIVDNESGNVQAYCGSQNFNDHANQGQVDGVTASRSPGSTLKPFLYALSIDEGIVLPQTLMQDIPAYFGAFQPENANGKYSGLVTASEALIKSLNIPAVRLLNYYGVQPFYQFLEHAGISTLFRDASDYGLTLIIGGCEVQLYELVRLYRGLARYGRFMPLTVSDSNIRLEDYPELISPGACNLILEELKNLSRPGSEYYWHQYEDQYPLAWKTGTSYGQRDAWAVGVNPQWTIGVWVGNFSGEINSNLSGAASAAPILFDIFNILPKDLEKIWFEPPIERMDTHKICHETGFSAGPDCVETDLVLVPEEMHSLRVCPYHQKVFFNDDETNQVCSLCWEQDHYHARTALVYPAKILHYLRERGNYQYDLPPHQEICPGASQGEIIRILYPEANARIWIPRDIGNIKQKIMLKVAHSIGDQTVYWYLDDGYLGSTVNIHEQAVSPLRGWHQLKVIDQDGNTALVSFEISYN